jgi:hypothetical protein
MRGQQKVRLFAHLIGWDGTFISQRTERLVTHGLVLVRVDEDQSMVLIGTLNTFNSFIRITNDYSTQLS